MKIEEQVCTEQQAKRLKVHGLSQSSLFYWAQPNFPGKPLEVVFEENITTEYYCYYKEYSAYTSSELGILLKYYCTYIFESLTSGFVLNNEFTKEKSYHKSEAEARAALLIFMIDEGHLTITDLNKIIESC